MKTPYLTMEDLAQINPTAKDQVQMIADLSHQLEEARADIDQLKETNRELRQLSLRAEGAREAMKELIMEIMRK